MSFGELFIIGIIALIVLGPERLPKAVRTVGLWIGKAKQSFNSIKTEIDRELKIQEIQQQLKDQQRQLESQIDIESISGSMNDSKNNLNHLLDEVSEPLSTPTAQKPKTTEPSTDQNDRSATKK